MAMNWLSTRVTVYTLEGTLLHLRLGVVEELEKARDYK